MGDDNTRYFHHSLQHLRKCSTIIFLHLQDRTTSDLKEIQEAFQKYYIDLQGNRMKERTRINMNVIHSGPGFNQDQQYLLDVNFTPDEIEDAMWSIPKDKAPGLDGFNSGFYRSAWEIVITLIPKVANPNTPGDYHPISCCNVIYKCIFKLICKKLHLVLGSIISPMQGAFIEGRSILHNILLCQDIVK